MLTTNKRREFMSQLISGWIFVFLAIACVAGYLFLADHWGKNDDGRLMGWFLFAIGFFIAGIVFLIRGFDSLPK
jgi:hypothetical protein